MSSASLHSCSWARRVARRQILCRGSSAVNGLLSQGSVATSKNFGGRFTPETGPSSVIPAPSHATLEGLAAWAGAFRRVHSAPFSSTWFTTSTAKFSATWQAPVPMYVPPSQPEQPVVSMLAVHTPSETLVTAPTTGVPFVHCARTVTVDGSVSAPATVNVHWAVKSVPDTHWKIVAISRPLALVRCRLPAQTDPPEPQAL